MHIIIWVNALASSFFCNAYRDSVDELVESVAAHLIELAVAGTE